MTKGISKIRLVMKTLDNHTNLILLIDMSFNLVNPTTNQHNSTKEMMKQ